MRRLLIMLAVVAVSAGFAVAPVSASVCCYVQEEQAGSVNYYMSDTYPNNPVNLTSIRETYYQEIAMQVFGGHTFFEYQDSKGYCLDAFTPTPHHPSFVGSDPCIVSHTQYWRWIANGSWHYLQNLHYGQNAVDATFVSGCGTVPGCSDVVMDPQIFDWGVFSG